MGIYTYNEIGSEKDSFSAGSDHSNRQEGLLNNSFPQSDDKVGRSQIQQLADNSPRITQLRIIQNLGDQYCNRNSSSIALGNQTAPVQLREKHKIKKGVTPYIHEFTTAAIDSGAPKRLTYLIDKKSVTYVKDIGGNLFLKNSINEDEMGVKYFDVGLHEVNRSKALSKGAQLSGKSKKHEFGLSRDEYPYASTYEGGSDSYWAYVPVGEQNSQGGQLANLYKRVIESGDPEFDVELD